jgi:anti-sigma factor RsiW
VNAASCEALEPLQSGWLDGELGPGERARLRRHLQHCRRCRTDLETLSRTRALVRSLPTRRVPDGVLGTPQVPAVPAAAGTRRPLVRVASAAALLAGLVGGAAFTLGGQPPQPGTVVQVPVDLFAVDHLVRTAGGPLPSALLVEVATAAPTP